MNSTSANMDLTDSKRDEERLQGDNAILDLPSVKDIPGQEHIRPMPPGEMADTTISSADEEGEGLLDDLNEDEDDEDEDEKGIDLDDETDVSPEEKEILHNAATYMPTADEADLDMASLDNTDEDGEPLNEGSSASAEGGEDLDVPGGEMDNEDENIGEEDEENNVYSTAQK